MSAASVGARAGEQNTTRRILGLEFFTGSPADALAVMKGGGLLVAPAAPALKDLPLNEEYREALLNADVRLTDSGFMVFLWNLLQRDRVPKLSGLAYLREFVQARPGDIFWVMSNPASCQRNLIWLRAQGIDVSEKDAYVAPIYKGPIADEELLARLRARRPAHIVLTLGGGTQERLGLYLKRNLEFRPAIHCVGAAIAFLSGDQVRIPEWADHLGMGWLFRCVWQPRRYVSRYWSARKLLALLVRYRENLPVRRPSGV
jgi:N-acetylglucosaminyldiphosphoundecaprenol N-acetyl-beta-D-mannosaminyltransferase